MLTMDAVAREATGVDVAEAETDEIRSVLDRQARSWLGISGDEFVSRWRAGRFNGSDDPAVSRLVSTALLLG